MKKTTYQTDLLMDQNVATTTSLDADVPKITPIAPDEETTTLTEPPIY